jgi:hypothetical protein
MLSFTWLRTRAVSSPLWLKRFNSKSFTYRYIIGIGSISIIISFCILISVIGLVELYSIKLDDISVYYLYFMFTVYLVPSVIMLLLNVKLIRNLKMVHPERNDSLRFHQNARRSVRREERVN